MRFQDVTLQRGIILIEVESSDRKRKVIRQGSKRSTGPKRLTVADASVVYDGSPPGLSIKVNLRCAIGRFCIMVRVGGVRGPNPASSVSSRYVAVSQPGWSQKNYKISPFTCLKFIFFCRGGRRLWRGAPEAVQAPLLAALGRHHGLKP